MAERYTVIPMVKVSPGMVIAYSILDPAPRRSPLEITVHGNAVAGGVKYTGILTPSSKRKLIRAINLLVAIALPKKAVHFESKKEFTFRVNFITLTLPAPQEQLTDKELKQKCLKQWIEFWKDRLPGMSYVWRAERQKNGNLHFHLVTDRYIHYKDLRDSWNRALGSTGLIDRFQAKNGHRHPNSTDVHAVKKIRDLAAYIAKYMSKTESTTNPIEGRVWDCSKNLKRKDQCAFPMSLADQEAFSELHQGHPDRAFDTEYCAGVRCNETQLAVEIPPSWYEEYQAFLNRIRG